MPAEMSPAALVAIAAQLLLLLTGVVLLWRTTLRRAARGQPPRLPVWDLAGAEFALACFFVLSGGFVGQLVMALAVPGDADLQLVLQGAGLQLGMLLGVALARVELRRRRPPPLPEAPEPTSAWKAGGATFLISLPVVLAVSWPWNLLLERWGFSTEKQELLDLFARADSPALVVLVTFLAVVVAPVVEELVFRAGLFRFLRTRIWRPVALLVPAVIFGSLHGNLVAFAPLVALGILFSLAYERTGRIAVPMIGHALFNLNTIVALLAGVNVEGT